MALEKLGKFLDAGVTCFVDLTEEHELEPYAGILEDEATRRGLRVRYQRLPIPDMGTPSVDRMRHILEVIDEAGQSGETLYLHCWGGVGRTGTVVGCCLIRHGSSAEAALQTVGELFGTMSPEKLWRHPEGSPQRSGQRAFVREWPLHDGAEGGSHG